jgi:hypothetical protein
MDHEMASAILRRSIMGPESQNQLRHRKLTMAGSGDSFRSMSILIRRQQESCVDELAPF